MQNLRVSQKSELIIIGFTLQMRKLRLRKIVRQAQYM